MINRSERIKESFGYEFFDLVQHPIRKLVLRAVYGLVNHHNVLSCLYFNYNLFALLARQFQIGLVLFSC